MLIQIHTLWSKSKQTALCGRHTCLETGQQGPSLCLFFQGLTCIEHSLGPAPLSPQETPWLSQATSQTLGPESPYKLQDWGCVIPVDKATLLFLVCTELSDLDMGDSSVSEGFLGTALLSTGRLWFPLSPTPTQENCPSSTEDVTASRCVCLSVRGLPSLRASK